MKFLTIFAGVIFLASPVLAETTAKVYQCGVPEEPVMDVDPAMDFCDIYTRQLAYVGSRKEFRSLIEQRRANYVIPRNQAYNAYRKKIRQNYYPGQ